MRLNDKLIRKNCPSCGGEITLEASSLDKKINCPKCRQTVIISNGKETTPAKPPAKKTMPKEKRNSHHAPSEKAPASMEELRISIQRRDNAEGTHVPGELDSHLPEKRAVIYCICNGVLKRCDSSSACCVKPEFCVFADELIL